MTTTTPFLPRELEPLTLPPAINMPRDKEKLTWIYGLSDPRDGQLYVIGRSVRPENASVLDGLDPRQGIPTDLTTRQEWGIDLARNYRHVVRYLLACVPQEWGEDYKRIYAEAAVGMGIHLLSYYALPDWRIDREVSERIHREAYWVLTQAYGKAHGLRSVPESWAPTYDPAIYARITRPSFTLSQWHDEKDDIERQQAYDAWLKDGFRALARYDFESQDDFDYRMGALQAEGLGIPVLDEARP